MPVAHINYNYPDSPFAKLFLIRPQPRKVYHDSIIKIMFVDFMIILFLMIMVYLCDILFKYIIHDHRQYVIIDGIVYDYYNADSDLSDSDSDTDDNFETAESDNN